MDIPSMFRKIGISKNFMHNRVCHFFLSKFFCLTVSKIFVIEFSCFWETFSFRNGFRMEKRVSHHSVEKFWSHSAEKDYEQPWNVSEKLWYRENLCILGVSVFSVENFRSDTAGKSVGIPSMFQNVWVNRKNSWVIGLSQLFIEKVLSHSAEIFCKGILLFLRNFPVSKSFCGWKEGIKFFRRKVLGLTVPKKLVGITSNFRKFGVIEKFYA